jgi:hypothetical protein
MSAFSKPVGRLAAITSVLLCLALPAGAQRLGGGSAPAEDLPLLKDDGKCPEETSSGERRTFREYRAELRGAGSREVILPGVVLYADADLARPLRVPPLDFGTEVTVLRWNQGGLDSHLIKRTTDKGARCAWIENAALLPEDRNEPLPIEALRADGLAGFSGVGSTLDAKVLVRNHYDADDDSAATGAPVYFRYTDPEPYKSLKIFNVLNVFDYVEHAGKVWFFVGGEKASEGRGAKQTLYGWARAEDLIPWSTLMNVYYRQGKDGVQIYENNSQAERGGEGFAAKADDEDLPEDRNVPRFPLLETVTQGPITVHRIAFPGTACDSAGNCISALASAVERAELGDEMWKAESIDFLFVIDATESMRKYFAPVVKGVRAFLKEADPGDRIKVRFSVIVYGDFLSRDSGRGSFQFARVVPFGSTKNEEQLDYLVGAESFTDNMYDLPEAAFAALIKAIKEAEWRDKAGWRMVIWIGDHPNRGGSLGGSRRIAYTENDVARALKDVDNGVWTAINVRGNYNAPYNGLFVEQAERILDLTKDAKGRPAGLPPRQAYDSVSTAETPEQVTEAVKASLFGILASGKDVLAWMERMKRGEDLDEGVDSSLPSAVLARKWIEENLGMSDEELRAFFKRSQLVREGWVRQPPGDPDFDYWVSVKPDEMADLVEAGDALCETLSDTSPDFNEVRDAMLATLRGVTGDVPKLTGPADETNIRLFLEKRLHVPKEQFSELLGKDIDGFVDWYKTADPGVRNAFSEGICRKSGLLRLAQNGLRVVRGPEDIVFDKRLRTWGPRDGSTRPFNWVWGTEDGIHYYYIPLEYVL